jgi:hypothetical protein
VARAYLDVPHIEKDQTKELGSGGEALVRPPALDAELTCPSCRPARAARSGPGCSSTPRRPRASAAKSSRPSCSMRSPVRSSVDNLRSL